MKRALLTITIIGAAMLTASDAFAGPLCGRGQRLARRAAPVTTARATDGYRAYSYEPGAVQPSASYGFRLRKTRAPYLDATSKALGRY